MSILDVTILSGTENTGYHVEDKIGGKRLIVMSTRCAAQVSQSSSCARALFSCVLNCKCLQVTSNY